MHSIKYNPFIPILRQYSHVRSDLLNYPDHRCQLFQHCTVDVPQFLCSTANTSHDRIIETIELVKLVRTRCEYDGNLQPSNILGEFVDPLRRGYWQLGVLLQQWRFHLKYAKDSINLNKRFQLQNSINHTNIHSCSTNHSD